MEKIKILWIVFFGLVLGLKNHAQHHNSKASIYIDFDKHKISVIQKLTYHNNSNHNLDSLVLNDWNHAFSSKKTALSKRFSDEFIRSYHFSSPEDLGHTLLLSIKTADGVTLDYLRSDIQPDLIWVYPKEPLLPNTSFSFIIQYDLKIPNSKFTGYGFTGKDKIELKDWLIFPTRVEGDHFLTYSNENLNDAPNARTDLEIEVRLSQPVMLTSNLEVSKKDSTFYILTGLQSNCVYLQAEPQTRFRIFNKDKISVETDLFDEFLDEFSTALLIHKIAAFVQDKAGINSPSKIVVPETDYRKNPFYGLNQLPSFIRPFPDNFMYELKFLKSYTESYLKSVLNVDFRKNNWIVNTLEMYLITEYLKTYYPNMKMIGNISKIGLLQGYYGTKMNFEDQFYYLYLMMARRNLDQPTGNPKNKLIKFNEQIAAKYKAGLDFNYLGDLLGKDVLQKTVSDFFRLNQIRQTDEKDFKELLTQNALPILKRYNQKDLNWFFDQLVYSRKLIDYKISRIKKQNDSLQITLKNSQEATVPISVYGLRDNQVIYKEWFFDITKDSLITLKNKDFDKVVLNYEEKIPEYNIRNNFRNLKFGLNRPLKLTFFKDFENPSKNQLFYIPEFRYNYYDGITPGIRLSNKSLLKKPFVFDLSPMYSFNTSSMVGSAYVGYEDLIRYGNLYSVNYSLLTNYYHYAPDAAYSRFIPSVLFRFRESNFRENNLQTLLVRWVNVNREHSAYAINLNEENYAIFNLRYSKNQNQITDYFGFKIDLQASEPFGKIASQIEFRKLFESNRQFNIRLFGGFFIHRNTTSDFFSFGTYRATDYLFDHNYYGRSESGGFFAQQYIVADGGFKSMLTPYANQWITSANASIGIWNWIEAYTDFGLLKNENSHPEWLYDSGIRLNFVPDYFEVYFPVYSKLGFEVQQPHYIEKIRIVMTLDPDTLIRLFTRRWL